MADRERPVGLSGAKAAVCLGFLAALVGLGAWQAMAPEKAYSDQERRYLAQRPEFSVEGLLSGDFGEDYEEYLSDQFPMRDAWVRLYTLAELSRGQRDVNGVYVGKDGWLLEKYDQESLETELLDENLETFAGFLLGMGETLGQDRVRVLLAPSSAQIEREKLPDLASPYDQGQVVGRLEALLGEGGAKMVIPAEQALAEGANRGEELYYRTDHHWTALGAYRAYEAWAASAGLSVLPLEAFEQQVVSRDFLGTIQAKVNLPVSPDAITLFLPKEGGPFHVVYDGGAKEADSLYSMEALEGTDQYSVYLDGNHGLTWIRNQGISEDRAGTRLLIVKDSFAHSFAPFAANHFEDVYLVDLRYFNLPVGQFAKENGITDALVLYQIPTVASDGDIWKMGR